MTGAPDPVPIPKVRIIRLRWTPFHRERWSWSVTTGPAYEHGTAYTHHAAYAKASDALWRMA